MVLAEGRRDHRFVWRYLREAGYEPRQIRPEPVPKDKGGAGDRWVLDRYAGAVMEYRQRAAKTALIVVIDADTGETTRRSQQLRDALGKNFRKEDEFIVHFIPRRNIETWILCLNGKEVDEEKDYRDEKCDDLIEPAAERFRHWVAQPPVKCLPSLADGLQEAKRLQ